MSSVDQSAVFDALRSVMDPDLHRDIVALGFVKDLQIDGGRVAFTIELTTPACPVKDAMRDQARAAVSAVPGVAAVEVTMTAAVRSAGTHAGRSRAGARREERGGDRRRQGRRRQDDARREPRRGARRRAAAASA